MQVALDVISCVIGASVSITGGILLLGLARNAPNLLLPFLFVQVFSVGQIFAVLQYDLSSSHDRDIYSGTGQAVEL